VDVLFTTCTSLTASLNAARATGAYERMLAQLARGHDEIGYRLVVCTPA